MARKTQTEILLELCPLVEWAGPGFCGGCNKDLGRPTRRWCSRGCEQGFVQNHQWGTARKATLERDGGCVRCGRDGQIEPELEWWIRWMRTLVPRGHQDPEFHEWSEWCQARRRAEREASPYGRFDTPAQWARKDLKMRKEWATLTGSPRLLWAHEFERLVAKVKTDRALEVNHKTPVMGRHADYGCVHHLSGLEVLCGQCHKTETARQRKAGEFKR